LYIFFLEVKNCLAIKQKSIQAIVNLRASGGSRVHLALATESSGDVNEATAGGGSEIT
jgi:hypothetical protein